MEGIGRIQVFKMPQYFPNIVFVQSDFTLQYHLHLQVSPGLTPDHIKKDINDCTSHLPVKIPTILIEIT